VVIAYINNMPSLSDAEKTAITEYLQAMDAETYANAPMAHSLSMQAMPTSSRTCSTANGTLQNRY
jgi:hypothetical protein